MGCRHTCTHGSCERSLRAETAPPEHVNVYVKQEVLQARVEEDLFFGQRAQAQTCVRGKTRNGETPVNVTDSATQKGAC